MKRPSPPTRSIRFAKAQIAAVLGGLAVTILDGETGADVDAAARAIAAATPAPLAAGPAALAGALAAHLDLPRAGPPPWPPLGRCLLVNGSLHPVSIAQAAYARAHGWRATLPGCAPGALAKGGCYVLNPDAGLAGAGLERAAAAGELVRGILDRAPLDALIVFGGDTAFAIHRALGAPDFQPVGEIVPGVPVSRCAGRVWITKAGGFGLPSILCDIQRLLT